MKNVIEGAAEISSRSKVSLTALKRCQTDINSKIDWINSIKMQNISRGYSFLPLKIKQNRPSDLIDGQKGRSY